MLLEVMDYQHLTKVSTHSALLTLTLLNFVLQDRSLGTVELKVRDLATKVKDPKYPYASTGKKEHVEPIRLEAKVYKGQLHYVAEFIPAIAVKGVSFESGENEIQRVVNDKGSDTSSMSSSDIELEAIPEGVTISRPLSGSPTGNSTEEEADSPTESKGNHKHAKSTDSTKTGETGKTNGTAESAESAETSAEEVGVEMSKEELMSHRKSASSS